MGKSHMVDEVATEIITVLMLLDVVSFWFDLTPFYSELTTWTGCPRYSVYGHLTAHRRTHSNAERGQHHHHHHHRQCHPS